MEGSPPATIRAVSSAQWSLVVTTTKAEEFELGLVTSRQCFSLQSIFLIYRNFPESPVAEGRVRKVWQNTILAAAAPDMRAHSNLFAPPASYSHGEKGDRHCAAEATAGSSHAPPPR